MCEKSRRGQVTPSDREDGGTLASSAPDYGVPEESCHPCPPLNLKRLKSHGPDVGV